MFSWLVRNDGVQQGLDAYKYSVRTSAQVPELVRVRTRMHEVAAVAVVGDTEWAATATAMQLQAA